MTIRGQFTYTACQVAGPYTTVPGWKVKEVVGVDGGPIPPESVVQAAVRPFGGTAMPPVPALATQTEIDDLPRCLRLDVLDETTRSVAHLAVAGRDHSGRDAFFAHGILVDLTPGRPPVDPDQLGSVDRGLPRPADLWGAQGWSTPFRAEAIEAERLGRLPRLSGSSPMDPERREDFVDLHPGQREFVLAAAERALTGGPPLVVVGLPVEAAMWTSVLTHLLVPTCGWSVPFSTVERGHPPAVLDGGSIVVGVPDAGLWSSVPADAASVLDPGRLRAGPDPAVFALPGGGTLAAGPWARLAEGLCRAGLEDRVRDAVDALGARVGRMSDDRPCWGLAAALLAGDGIAPPLVDLVPDLAHLAQQVFAAHLPARLLLPVDLVDAVLAAVARGGSVDSGPGAAGAMTAFLGALQDAGATTALEGFQRGHLRRILYERSAFTADLPFVPAVRPAPPGSPERAGEQERSGWVDRETDPLVQARWLLTLVAIGAGDGRWSGPSGERARFFVTERARLWVAPLLMSGAAIASGGWPRLPDWLWTEVEGALTETPPTELDRALGSPAVRGALDRAGGPLPTVFSARVTLPGLSPLACRRAAAELRARPQDGGRGGASDADQILRAAAVLAPLPDGSPVAAAILLGEVDRCFPGRQVRTDVLDDLLTEVAVRHPGTDVRAVAVAVLGRTPPSPAAAALAGRLVREHPGRTGAELLTWHQVVVRLPSTPWLAEGHRLARRPSVPEQQVLEAVVDGRLAPAMAAAGQMYLARWVMIQPAAVFLTPGPRDAGEFNLESPRPRWLAAAAGSGLRSAVAPTCRQASEALVHDLRDGADDGSARVELAAQWLVRALLARRGLADADPAKDFFGGSRPDGRPDWFRAVRALVGRGDPSLTQKFGHAVMEAADLAHRASRPIARGLGAEALQDVEEVLATLGNVQDTRGARRP
ncbi:hypothetical protein JL107_08550 [Nakamurella flavida]|uniref:GTPase-associated protein 1 N-terminal domain-containing protein n=1 Tax=Nakamurella flavida TaxID=363630 RepID=A0A939C095_9ACTN|nr:hypothetical protein [Nakamurella flavida]MBM9476488.1 hypothetical protein [Nakamurella flavida]MDP9779076.1 hypothetical protein [Nakamurella flavida]